MNRVIISIFVLSLFIIGCGKENPSENGWTTVNREKKTVDNITYYFSADISVQRREAAILECQNAVINNLKLINEEDFTNKMDIEFLADRDEMLKFGGMSAQGLAYPNRNTFFTLLKDEGSPITHEMMHMIASYKWGTPPGSSTWMNEGLATYSDTSCLAYSLTEIYKYFIQSEKLIPLATLSENFYHSPEMIGYTQSAFTCGFLIDNYGLDKFKELWKGGFDEFQNIYSFSVQDLENMLIEYVNNKLPNNIEFDWEEYEKGC